MPINPLIASAALGDGDKPINAAKPAVKVDNNLRRAWNDYTSWLDKKGLKGHPSLDHNDLSFKMIDEYRRQNPKTPLNRDTIIPIQQEF